MESMHGICPACGAVQKWEFNNPSIGYPPTGGDYDWAEVPAETTCPTCKEKITARVKVDLDTHQVSKLISSPMPTQEGWSCFAVAFVEQYGVNSILVKVLHFASTQAAAQRLLDENHAVSVGAAAPSILKLSKNGFMYLDGNLVQSTIDEQIRYF